MPSLSAKSASTDRQENMARQQHGMKLRLLVLEAQWAECRGSYVGLQRGSTASEPVEARLKLSGFWNRLVFVRRLSQVPQFTSTPHSFKDSGSKSLNVDWNQESAMLL